MTINPSKGQTLSLDKQAPGLAKVHMGLGWDPAKKEAKGLFGKLLGGGGADEIDLDASCLVFSGNGQLLDTVWFRQLTSRDGSIRHSGDNLTGEGDGDDEIIKVDLTSLPADAVALVFTVNSFRGQTFNEVDNAFVRIVNDANHDEIAKFELRDKGSFTGVIMGILTRKSGSWEFRSIGEPLNGRVAGDMANEAARFL